MIGRADIEGSKSNVAMNAWLPQASYPCGNFSGTSSLKFRGTKGSIGHTFMVCIHTGGFVSIIVTDCSTEGISYLKIKIKAAFALLLYWRFLFSMSCPLDTCVMV